MVHPIRGWSWKTISLRIIMKRLSCFTGLGSWKENHTDWKLEDHCKQRPFPGFCCWGGYFCFGSSPAVLFIQVCLSIKGQNSKIVYRKYAALYFTISCDLEDNDLLMLETIHLFVCSALPFSVLTAFQVEILDSYFGNVCELDLVFQFFKVGCWLLATYKIAFLPLFLQQK